MSDRFHACAFRAPRTPSSIVIPVVAALTVALSSDRASAQSFVEPGVEVLHTSAGVQLNEQYGYVSETIADLTGDGVPEVLNSAPFRTVGGLAKAGAAFVHDGATGTILVTHLGTTGQGFLGWRLACLGDVDADGVPDYGIGAAGDIFQTDLPIPGEAFVFSGADHSVIHHLQAATYAEPGTDLQGDRFGQDISPLGDVNGDGHADFIVTADRWDAAIPDAGRAWILSGADASVLRIHDGDAFNDRFGSAANGIGDVTADGVADYIVCARNGGAANRGVGVAYDGASGDELFRFRGDSPTMQGFGQYFASSPGDATGDGVPDLYVGDFVDARHGPWTGAAYLFDTAAGLADPDAILGPVWSVVGTEASQSVGFGGGVGDVDGDGCVDIATSFLSNLDMPDTRWAGIVRVYSGRTGQALRRITSLQGNGPTIADWGEQFGYSISGAGDVNADGWPDLFVTAGFGRDEAERTVGRVYTIAGVPPCPADFDGDRDVDFDDLLVVLGCWGPADRACSAADLAPDPGGPPVVGFEDLLVVLASWDGCPSSAAP